MLDLTFVEDEALKNGITKMLYKNIESWIGCLETIKATHHSIDLKEGTRPFRQQLFRIHTDYT